MLFKLIIIFTIIPVMELYLFLKIGAIIGAANTVAVVLITGLAGAVFAQREGIKTVYKIKDALEAGEVPTEEIVNAFFIFVGGILLLTPGFLSDLLGLAILIPFLRKIIKDMFFKFMRKKMSGKKLNINIFEGL